MKELDNPVSTEYYYINNHSSIVIRKGIELSFSDAFSEIIFDENGKQASIYKMTLVNNDVNIFRFFFDKTRAPALVSKNRAGALSSSGINREGALFLSGSNQVVVIFIL